MEAEDIEEELDLEFVLTRNRLSFARNKSMSWVETLSDLRFCALSCGFVGSGVSMGGIGVGVRVD
jgi:hypothetical protein